METEDINAGMTVKVRDWDYRPDHWCEDGGMDDWRGAVVTIAEIHDSEEVYLEDDEGVWQWYAWDFEPYHRLSNTDPNMLYKEHKRNSWMDKVRDNALKMKKGGYHHVKGS